MTRVTIFIFLALFSYNNSFAQKIKHPPINNMRGMMLLVKNDNAQERFSIEANLGKIFASFQMPLLLSINLINQGSPLKELAEARVQNELSARGINSVIVVSIRGFDQRFKPRTKIPEKLIDILEEGNLYPISQEDASSVTVEFFQYIGGNFNGYHMMRIGGASDRTKVYNRILKRLNRLVPRWQQ
jgi:hypothetical protein